MFTPDHDSSHITYLRIDRQRNPKRNDLYIHLQGCCKKSQTNIPHNYVDILEEDTIPQIIQRVVFCACAQFQYENVLVDE